MLSCVILQLRSFYHDSGACSGGGGDWQTCFARRCLLSADSYLAFALCPVTQVLWFKCETRSMSNTFRALKHLRVEG